MEYLVDQYPGVKYTTARMVAEQAMDLAVNQLGMKKKNVRRI